MIIDELAKQFMGFELVEIEEDSMFTLGNFLRAILTQDDAQDSINLMLFLAYHGANYRPMNMRLFLQGYNGTYEDPLFQDLTLAVASFAESPHFPRHKERLPAGQVRIKHITMAQAFLALEKKCAEQLPAEDLGRLDEEAKAQGHADWKAYLRVYVTGLSRD